MFRASPTALITNNMLTAIEENLRVYCGKNMLHSFLAQELDTPNTRTADDAYTNPSKPGWQGTWSGSHLDAQVLRFAGFPVDVTLPRRVGPFGNHE